MEQLSSNGTTRGLVWHGDRDLALEPVERPVPGEGQVELAVELAGICGSDLHGYRGHPGPRVPPLVLGHEAVGRVRGEGQHFVVFPLAVCGACDACRRGEENLCERRGLLGLDRPGVFAERIVVDERQLVPLPAGVGPAAAVLVEPLATSVAALRALGASTGERVAVIGCGPVGLLAVYACAARGLRVTAVEPLPGRRAIAARLGAETQLADVAGLPPATFDAVLDTAGFEASWTAGIAAVRAGGAVVLIGLGAAQGQLPAADLVRRGIRLLGHYAYTRADFEASLALLAEHELPLDWIATMGLEEGAEAFRRLVDEPDRQAKVVLAIGRQGA